MSASLKNKVNDLITLERALALSREENRDNHRRFVNPELTAMMSMLDFDKRFVRAAGVSVWDDEGREYLDFLGAYGAINLGHNQAEVAAAVAAAAEAPNLLQSTLNPLAGALARNLALLTPGDLQYSFFCNSGAESVEGALKLARAATGRRGILSCTASFHGKSFGALSVTGREKYRRPFEPLLPGVEFLPYGNADALEKALRDRGAAAFIVEPIQGEGGIILPPAGYLARARELCTAAGTLLIFDEVQTGFGRTGKLFASEFEGVVPDIMCLSKSFGGGIMPLAAYIASGSVWKSAYGGMENATLHTSTFGGNSRAAAAGLATLEILCRDDLPARAMEMGDYLMTGLKALQEKYPLLQEVRGRGLMIGLELAQPKNGLLNKVTGGAINRLAGEYSGAMVAGELLNRHAIITAYTLNNPNVIRLEPPLILTMAQADRLLEALDDIFARYKGLGGMAVSSTRTVIGSLLGRRPATPDVKK